MVFTRPAEVAAIAFQNKAMVYTILFKAAAETLRTIAADPRHLELAAPVVLAASWKEAEIRGQGMGHCFAGLMLSGPCQQPSLLVPRSYS
ncbi:hypothetical protein A9K71_21425 [Mesorhizobium sp. WSM3873]|nr:hypothetical protein A9K71_21425 [Mesorhizobium sp. WSM3873]